MLYHLFKFIESTGADFPGMGLMNYLSFRAMGAAVTAVLIAMIAGKKIIYWLQRKQIGETVRDLGLEGQIQKKGTPTMGGIIIILSIVCGVLLWCDLTNIYVILLLVSTLWCGALGFADDYIKVFRHNKEGMSEKGKLLGQIVLGFIVGLTVWMSPDIVVREKVEVKESVERTLETETTVTRGRYVEDKDNHPLREEPRVRLPLALPRKGHLGLVRKMGYLCSYDSAGNYRMLQRNQSH